jgi:twitching motility protein PilT
MSRWIDAFLQMLESREGAALEMCAGEPARLRVSDSVHLVSKQTVPLEHLLALARQGLGNDGWNHFEEFGESSWEEARDGRRYVYHARGGPGRLHVEVMHAEDVAPQTIEIAAPPAPADSEPAAPRIEPATVEPVRAVARAVTSLDELLRATHAMRASDLHLTAGMPPVVRVDGALQRLPDARPLSAEDLEKLLTAATPARNREELEQLWDTDFGHEIAGVSRFRVNLFHDRFGIGGVFRVVPNRVPRPEDLGLPASLVEMTQLSKGIILVTGPTGSGKSTTLAALVNHINDSRDDHVITIEDPIEFVHESRRCLVNQREVGTHAQSFKRALREALREDPDIVLVGEMRDLETVHIALETAETGHLVFGTLHTTSGPSTVDRLIDQFPAAQQQQIRIMLADTLRCVVAQVLCRRKQGGRVAALEIMMGTPAIANLIREGKTHQMLSIMQTSRAEGMQTMTDALVRLVQENVISAEEALARATHRDEVVRALERAAQVNGRKR